MLLAGNSEKTTTKASESAIQFVWGGIQAALSNQYVYNEDNHGTESSARKKVPLDRLLIAPLFKKFPASTLS
jgi:hypothetical protein